MVRFFALALLGGCADDEPAGGGGSGANGGGGSGAAQPGGGGGAGAGGTAAGGGGADQGGSGGDGGSASGGGGTACEGGGAPTPAVTVLQHLETPWGLDHAPTSDGGTVVAVAFDNPLDLGGGVLTPSGSRQVAIARYAPDGTHLFSKLVGTGGTVRSGRVAVGVNDEIYLAGHFGGTVDFGGGGLTATSHDIYLIALDAMGSHQWSRSFGNLWDEVPYELLVAPSGALVMTGRYDLGLDLGGGPLPDSGFMRGAFVARFAADGTHEFSLGYPDNLSTPESAHVVAAVGADESVYVTGNFAGTFPPAGLSAVGAKDMYLMRLTATGEVEWAQSFGSPGDESGTAIALGPQGEVIVAGTVSGGADFGGGLLTSAGGPDLALASFDAEGNHLVSRLFGDAGWQVPFNLVARSDGSIVVVGNTTSDFAPDCIPLFGEPPPYSSGFFLHVDAALQVVGGAGYPSDGDGWLMRPKSWPDDSVHFVGRYQGSVDVGGTQLSAADIGLYRGRLSDLAD